MANKEKKERGLLSKIILGIGAVWLLLMLFGVLLMAFQVATSVGWKDRPIEGEDERKEIAQTDFLMTSLWPFIEKHSYKGMRDYDDVFETIWFPSADELFDVLPYLDQEERREAKDLFAQLSEEGNIHDLYKLLGGDMKVYRVNFLLPLESEKNNRSDYWNAVYRYEYYIVLNPQENDQAKLICYRMEY